MISLNKCKDISIYKYSFSEKNELYFTDWWLHKYLLAGAILKDNSMFHWKDIWLLFVCDAF
mgnify:CR=1 FL=1